MSPKNSEHLAQCMPEAEYIVWEKTGHGLGAQWPDKYHDLLERVFEEGRQRSSQ